MQERNLSIIWIMIIGVVGRLVPHAPNMTPLTGVSLFSGANLPKKLSFLILFVTLLISDVGLALIAGYPIFGYFTLFNYSGFTAIVLFGSKLKFSKLKFPLVVIGSSLFFWLWTNFGMWFTTSLYPKTLNGLINCYYVALPFLGNSLISDIISSYLIFGAFYIILKKRARVAELGRRAGFRFQ